MNSVLCHYFPLSSNWTVTPEQIQDETNKRPDFVVEKVDVPDPNAPNPLYSLVPHVYVEIKRNRHAGFRDAMDQIVDTTRPPPPSSFFEGGSDCPENHPLLLLVAEST